MIFTHSFKKRIFDIIFSFIGLVLVIPLIIPFIFLIWLQDFENPFYIADRVGLNFKKFKIIKLRSMIVKADKSKVDSTSANDPRITKVGAIIRKLKLDELTQLFNVFKGEMSFVGPRPNVERETNLYSNKEKELLKVKPGITDFASIVFSDESEILKDHQNPDIAYNQLIRPRKNFLALTYIKNKSIILDLKIILLTIFAFINKRKTLSLIIRILRSYETPEEIIEMARRNNKLTPMAPPGLKDIIYSREI
ncbi:Glycosyltransferase [Prochlorococcus marinus str. MIT 9302]|uniref:Glycosyltransferase n=1 Tax=Prochlorococcus marinus str. MIT 9302 TaxID=74545 RepID=A0A0A2A8Z0_PROMR|nr:sugar transferase [Prochlorococcus marinus]KGF96888.1 Glycosyltransferase [Prochlorococcus marinus str. MIT 9302]